MKISDMNPTYQLIDCNNYTN